VHLLKCNAPKKGIPYREKASAGIWKRFVKLNTHSLYPIWAFTLNSFIRVRHGSSQYIYVYTCMYYKRNTPLHSSVYIYLSCGWNEPRAILEIFRVCFLRKYNNNETTPDHNLKPKERVIDDDDRVCLSERDETWNLMMMRRMKPKRICYSHFSSNKQSGDLYKSLCYDCTPIIVIIRNNSTNDRTEKNLYCFTNWLSLSERPTFTSTDSIYLSLYIYIYTIYYIACSDITKCHFHSSTNTNSFSDLTDTLSIWFARTMLHKNKTDSYTHIHGSRPISYFLLFSISRDSGEKTSRQCPISINGISKTSNLKTCSFQLNTETRSTVHGSGVTIVHAIVSVSVSKDESVVVEGGGSGGSWKNVDRRLRIRPRYSIGNKWCRKHSFQTIRFHFS